MLNVSGGELAHLDGAGITRLRYFARRDGRALQVGVAQNPKRFSCFVSTDVTKPNAIEVLRRHLAAGPPREAALR